MSAICPSDTSVFMEILNIPGKASHHKKTADLRYFNWLTSGYYAFPVVSSSLCVLCELCVSVVETSLATGYNQWSRTTTTEAQSARRTHRELYYSITHSKQLGTKTSSVHLQTSSPHLQTSSHLLPMNPEHLERLELRYPDKPTHPDQGYRAKNRIPEQEARNMSGMQPLEKSLRSKLERAVREARDIAEDAAKVAVVQLGVGEARVPPYLTDEQKAERKKLRAHGRQLGDLRDEATQNQQIDRLVEEVAYEHWHRMLFARFLAENNLLMYPDPVQPVPITLEECEDLAAEEGAKNGWELAARFAARMLPQIFRPDSPVFQLALPPEHQQKLERLLAELPAEVFFASDSLGWVYQFWQAKKKDEINASEVKIGARELPAVTQLFTEPYMVAFLLDNSLGAWWAARRLTEDDLRNAKAKKSCAEGIAARRAAGLSALRAGRGRQVGPGSRDLRRLAGSIERVEGPRSLLRIGPFPGGSPAHAGVHAHGAGRAICSGGGGRRSAGKSARPGDRPALRGAGRFCPGLCSLALSGGGRIPDAAGAESGLLGAVHQRQERRVAGSWRTMMTICRLFLIELYEQFKDAPVSRQLDQSEVRFFKRQHCSDEMGRYCPAPDKGPVQRSRMMRKRRWAWWRRGLPKLRSFWLESIIWIITNVPYLPEASRTMALKDFCDRSYQ